MATESNVIRAEWELFLEGRQDVWMLLDTPTKFLFERAFQAGALSMAKRLSLKTNNTLALTDEVRLILVSAMAIVLVEKGVGGDDDEKTQPSEGVKPNG